jgi:SAM-dependent methyltransferase
MNDDNCGPGLASGLVGVTSPCPHPVSQLKLLFTACDYITGHRFEVAHCDACGFAVTTPQPAAEQMAAYYPPGYYGAPGGRRFPAVVERLQQKLYESRVRLVESVAAGARGRVLDVGCGRGLLLREFQRRGWEVQGTELSGQAAGYARDVLKLPVQTGSLETIGFPAEHFDAITLWHVLEHLADPRVLLAEARRILKPQGVLLVGVPNFGGWEARFCRDKWFHLDVPRHLTHLSRPMLRQVLAENGFGDRRWSGFAPEYDSFSFMQSMLNRCGLRHNLLYNLLRRGRAKVIDGGAPGWQLIATLLLSVPLGVLSVPFTLCAGLAGRGGTMTVAAVKERR